MLTMIGVTMLLIRLILISSINDDNLKRWTPVTGQGYLCVYVHEEAILCVLMMDNYGLMISSNHERVDAKARGWP